MSIPRSIFRITTFHINTVESHVPSSTFHAYANGHLSDKPTLVASAAGHGRVPHNLYREFVDYLASMRVAVNTSYRTLRASSACAKTPFKHTQINRLPADIFGHTENGLRSHANVPRPHGGNDISQFSHWGQNKFHDTLIGRIQGNPSTRQVQAMRDLLAKIEDDPQAKAILKAMQALHELRHIAPEINLGTHSDYVRPSLDRPTHNTFWNLDWNLNLDALNNGSKESVRRELAAVYNNMTGVLQGRNPFANLLGSGGPRLDDQLEQAWDLWAGSDFNRQAVVVDLRNQLKEERCYGGLKLPHLRELLRGETFIQNLGQKEIDLSNRNLDSAPPLPGDTDILYISGNNIRDWRNLPPHLKTLHAAATGGSRVLDHLPTSLIELDVSHNDLDSLPAVAFPPEMKLKHLNANNNNLRTLPPFLVSMRTLESLHLGNNRIREVRESDVRAWLQNLEALNLSYNQITQLPNLSATLLKSLDLSGNSRLSMLSAFPASLRTLKVEQCDLRELPTNLPDLKEIFAASNKLRWLPNDLRSTLLTLDLSDNLLTELPPNIGELVNCQIRLQSNPILLQDIPLFPTGQSAPRILFMPNTGRDGVPSETVARTVQRVSMTGATPPSEHTQINTPPADIFGHTENGLWQRANIWQDGVISSSTVAQAVQYWLSDPNGEAAARWNTLGQELENRNTDAADEFRGFLDRLRRTASYKNADARASVEELLSELSKPERHSLLEEALKTCVGATEHCNDRVALTLNELRKCRLDDDIRLGRYNDRPAEALEVMRQLFRLEKLEHIAYNKYASIIESGRTVDDVEVYLGYAVKLREPLGLSTVVPDMDFFGCSRIEDEDLAAALEAVWKAEDTEFYKELVIDNTWNALLHQKLGTRHDEAMKKRSELAGEPLRERTRAALVERGLVPEDPTVELKITPVINASVWRDMEYELLEPLTRDFLKSENIPLP